MKCKYVDLELQFSRQTLKYEIKISEMIWKWAKEYKPYIIVKDKKIFFEDAKTISHEKFEDGIGVGIKSKYTYDREVVKGLIFETKVWIEKATKDVIFELIPLKEPESLKMEVVWPGPMEFVKNSSKWYTLFNEQQGNLLPNTWKTNVNKIILDGQMCSLASYMPWFGQVKEKEGYLAICETPWDAKYYIDYVALTHSAMIGIKWISSLKKLRYGRIMRYKFQKECDYNILCKIYRNYVKEQGEFCDLNEKQLKLPNIESLIGSMVVHQCVKKNIDSSSQRYDRKEETHSKIIRSYEELRENAEKYKEKKIKKLYFHIDGWGEPGYDNQHPDYYEICKDAGGIVKFKEFIDVVHKNGYICGLHDQYRDYYVAAKSFNENLSVLPADGEILYSNRWDGGKQTYLCATFALYFLKRNLMKLKEEGVNIDAMYLDAFTCNEPEECYNPEHRMSRYDCIRYRQKCFDYLSSNNIIPSSEDVSHWSIKNLVIPHFAPYSFMMKPLEAERDGIPVPLFNLVFHDCVIIPWPMEKTARDDYMLYALINGGIPYLVREGAYNNVDAVFDGYEKIDEHENISRCKIVANLHALIGKEEMLFHHFIDDDYLIQEVQFANGIVVKINLHDNTYNISRN